MSEIILMLQKLKIKELGQLQQQLQSCNIKQVQQLLKHLIQELQYYAKNAQNITKQSVIKSMISISIILQQGQYQPLQQLIDQLNQVFDEFFLNQIQYLNEIFSGSQKTKLHSEQQLLLKTLIFSFIDTQLFTFLNNIQIKHSSKFSNLLLTYIQYMFQNNEYEELTALFNILISNQLLTQTILNKNSKQLCSIELARLLSKNEINNQIHQHLTDQTLSLLCILLSQNSYGSENNIVINIFEFIQKLNVEINLQIKIFTHLLKYNVLRQINLNQLIQFVSENINKSDNELYIQLLKIVFKQDFHHLLLSLKQQLIQQSLQLLINKQNINFAVQMLDSLNIQFQDLLQNNQQDSAFISSQIVQQLFNILKHNNNNAVHSTAMHFINMFLNDKLLFNSFSSYFSQNCTPTLTQVSELLLFKQFSFLESEHVNSIQQNLNAFCSFNTENLNIQHIIKDNVEFIQQSIIFLYDLATTQFNVNVYSRFNSLIQLSIQLFNNNQQLKQLLESSNNFQLNNYSVINLNVILNMDQSNVLTRNYIIQQLNGDAPTLENILKQKPHLLAVAPVFIDVGIEQYRSLLKNVVQQNQLLDQQITLEEESATITQEVSVANTQNADNQTIQFNESVLNVLSKEKQNNQTNYLQNSVINNKQQVNNELNTSKLLETEQTEEDVDLVFK